MVRYNPKIWFRFIFSIHRSDTIRELFPILVVVAIYAAIVDFLLLEVVGIDKASVLLKISYIHQTIGFLFSLLLAFRINSAYDRWWEGRKLWGSLINCSRNVSMKLKSQLLNEESISFFNFAIPFYSRVLKSHLRDHYTHEEQDFIRIDPKKHVPNQVATAIFERVYQLNRQGLINTEYLKILNEDLTNFTDICGSCERIKKTPIPFSYSVFIKKFIFTYIMTLPFAWVIELRYFVVPIVCFILFVFASIELIAEEIENPFGVDDNDLPLDIIADNIKVHVGEIFDVRHHA